MKNLQRFTLVKLILLFFYGISYAQTFKDETSFKFNQNSYVSQVYDYKILTIFDSINNYITKYKITTTKNLQLEGQNREFEISVYSVSDLQKPKYTITQYCDEIDLQNYYYITKVYGCCSEPTITKIFDYSNEIIISGTSSIYEVVIPNKKLRMFISYEESDNSDNFGYINIVISHNERYRIKLIGNKNIDELKCPFVFAEAKFDIKEEDKFYNNSLLLFSQEYINSLKQLNLSFSLTFNCDFKHKPITIDIINGLPFGKDSKLQEYKIIE
jgi:hypothetical protein